jgi:hypothetical protein
MRARDIEEKAQAYLAAHPQLYWAALDRAIKLGFIDPLDRDRFLDLLEITRYFSVSRTEDGKVGVEKPRDFLSSPG